jgi:autophagy-related protein 2
MPKRLLQYALSRLEILDTNALGLDNVDIALGKNTVLEFRDVGLRLKVTFLFLGFTCSIC